MLKRPSHNRKLQIIAFTKYNTNSKHINSSKTQAKNLTQTKLGNSSRQYMNKKFGLKKEKDYMPQAITQPSSVSCCTRRANCINQITDVDQRIDYKFDAILLFHR